MPTPSMPKKPLIVDLGQASKPKMIGLQDILSFGKHKGEKVSFVLKKDPKWLVWAHEKVDWFNLDEDILLSAQEKTEERDSRNRTRSTTDRLGAAYDEDEDDADDLDD